jgi:hypothetical protein
MSQDPHDQLVLHIRGAVAEKSAAPWPNTNAPSLPSGCVALGCINCKPACSCPGVCPPTATAWARSIRAIPRASGWHRWRAPWYKRSSDATWPRACALTAGRNGSRRKAWQHQGKAIGRGNTIRGVLHHPSSTGQVYAGRTVRRPSHGRFSALRPVVPGSTSQMKQPPAAWIPVAPWPPFPPW